MREILQSIEAEYRRYKALADATLGQLSPAQWSEAGADTNSVAVIVWHMGGNLASRFTDFLETDGEKPWRDRDDEFAARAPTPQELTDHWERGWSTLFSSLEALTDDDLHRTVTIRGTSLPVHAALHRSLAHASYHVGQMVYRARALLGSEWSFLSIPPGGSRDYNRNPTSELADQHAARLNDSGPES